MNSEVETGRRGLKAPFVLLTVLGVHVVAAGFFLMMSGCQTRKAATGPAATEAVGQPPPPVMPPSATADVIPARPPMRPPAPVETLSESLEGSTYVVQKGDSLSKIAAKAGVRTAELAEINKITNRDSIRVGQRLLLPAHAKAIPAAPAAPSAPSSPESKPSAGPAVDSGSTHTVVSGDSLGKLAKRYGTTIAAFRDVNNLKSDTIKIGQKLKIPSGSGRASSEAPVAEPVAEAVAPASTPAPEPVVETAPPAPVTEEPAAVLDASAAPSAVEPPPAPPVVTETISTTGSEAPFPYTVKEGDTLDSVAVKFSARKEVIMQLNNMTDETLSPNQKILIPWQ